MKSLVSTQFALGLIMQNDSFLEQDEFFIFNTQHSIYLRQNSESRWLAKFIYSFLARKP